MPALFNVTLPMLSLHTKRDTKEKNDFSCVSRLPFQYTRKATLTTRKHLVSQKRCKNERLVASSNSHTL